MNYGFAKLSLLGGCGGKRTNSSGEIDFRNPSQDTSYCIWLIQFPAARFIKLNFTKFQFTGNCSSNYVQVYQGSVVSNTTSGYLFCSTTEPAHPVVLYGPYVTVYLQRNNRQLQSGQFRLIYGYNETGIFTYFSFISTSRIWKTLLLSYMIS